MKTIVSILCIMACGQIGAWGMQTDFIPAKPPNDSINASRSEIAAVMDWAGTVFGKDGVKPESRILVSAEDIPFSFKYGGRSWRDLHANWKRTVTRKDSADRVCFSTTWSDPRTGLAVTADVTAFKDYPAVEWLLRFENKGSADSPIIQDVQTVDVELSTGDAAQPVVLHQLHGDSCGEMSFLPFDTTLAAGERYALAPARGRPSQETAFPFWNLRHGDRGVVTAVGWSGQWAASFDRASAGPTKFRAGMEKTHLLLHPGESIRTPRVLMMFWHGDRRAAQNRFRRLMLFKYVPKQHGKPLHMPVCLQTFDRYHPVPGWATEQGQINAVNVARKLGCDTYWFDAAWFVGGFPSGAGNWYHKPEEFPRGLKPIGDLCRDYGMDFVLWFEPCRVAPDTQIAREHPEFVLGGQKGGLFNLGDPNARRWMTDLLSRRIREYGVTVYREDYNIDPLDFWRNNDAPDRQGMSEIRFVEGHYAMWDELRKRHPGLWIDDCASGGRRIDLETCMRSVPLWRSDTGCSPGHSEWNQMQTMALLQFVPLNTNCGWDPEPYTIRSSATAGVIVQFAYLDPAFAEEAAEKTIAEAKDNRKYWYGDLYPLTPITTSLDQIAAYQLHRADLDEGMVMAFRRPECEAKALSVRLNALKSGARYELEIVDESWKTTTERLSGDRLMSAGLELRLPEKRSSVLVRYKPAR